MNRIEWVEVFAKTLCNRGYPEKLSIDRAKIEFISECCNYNNPAPEDQWPNPEDIAKTFLDFLDQFKR